MANFRRRKPAHRVRGGRISKWRVAELEKKHRIGKWWWMGSWPSWHDTIYHRRPARRAEQQMTVLVRRDVVDPDEALWPLRHRPHRYYW